jgi:pyruvate dehydrogenase E2 component (dihydrolipoamide acetyltransferase)
MMQYMFKFPDIGEGLTEGKIFKWYVEKGQTIKSGDPLVEMETDKVVTDIPSPKSGVVVKTFGNVGDTVQVGSVLIEMEIEGVTGTEAQVIAAEKPAGKTEHKVEEKSFGVVGTIEAAGDAAYLPSTGEGLQPAAVIEKPEHEKVLSTPVARAMAKEMGVNISTIKGTGPSGRITKNDVENFQPVLGYQSSQTKVQLPEFRTSAGVEPVPLSQMRKTIARNMLRSELSTAPMSVMDEVEISDLVLLRERYKERYKEHIKLSYLPFIIKAITMSLQTHPVLNAELDMVNEQIIYKKYYNIGIAVDTSEGLIVPVIKDADSKSIIELAFELQDLITRAQERKLSLDEIRGGSFTITNYGSIGGHYAVPVINYPEVAILGVGKLAEKPIVLDGKIVIGKMLPISMSVDHRIVDGAEVGRFLNDFMQYLKDPLSMFLE